MNSRPLSLRQRQRVFNSSLETQLGCPLPTTRLTSRLDRRINRYTTTLLSGRPYRPPNHLRDACKLLRLYVRFAERDRKENPQFYPSPREVLQELQRAEREAEIRRAIDKVYGAPPATVLPGSPPMKTGKETVKEW